MWDIRDFVLQDRGRMSLESRAPWAYSARTEEAMQRRIVKLGLLAAAFCAAGLAGAQTAGERKLPHRTLKEVAQQPC